MRGASRRLTRWIARAACLGWFRSVEVSGVERADVDGPLIVVANHQGGFVDPALLTAVLPRTPRFLAMATLWKTLPLRPFLALAGAIPVSRAEDGATSGNASTFAACHDVLREGGAIAVFPEGQASDAVRLLRVKTGAARIALGARARGATGIRVLPVGLIYETKQRARSRAFVRVGAAIDLDEAIAASVEPGEAGDETDREAVRRLTDVIERRLADVSLDFRDAAQAADLWFAAAVSLRRVGGSPTWSPPLSALEERADALADAPDADQARVRDATADYRRALDANAVTDVEVAAGRPHGLGTRRIVGTVATLIALPFAFVGFLVNLVPAALVHLVGRRPAAPVTLATAKFLVGLLAFPLAWVALRVWVVEERPHPLLLTFFLGPVCGLIAAVVADRLRRARLARLRPGRFVLPDRAHEDLLERRAWLVESVSAAAAGPADP